MVIYQALKKLFSLHLLTPTLFLFLLAATPSITTATQLFLVSNFNSHTEVDLVFGTEASTKEEESVVRNCVKSELYRGDRLIASTGYGVIKFIDRGVTKGKDYTYRVVGYSSCNDTKWSYTAERSITVNTGTVNGLFVRPMTLSDNWEVGSLYLMEKLIVEGGTLKGTSELSSTIYIHEGGDLEIRGGTLDNISVVLDNKGVFSADSSTIVKVSLKNYYTSTKDSYVRSFSNNILNGFSFESDKYYLPTLKINNFTNNKGSAGTINLLASSDFVLQNNSLQGAKVSLFPATTNTSITIQNNTFETLRIFNPLSINSPLSIKNNIINGPIEIQYAKNQPFVVTKNRASSVIVSGPLYISENDTRSITLKESPPSYNRIISKNTLTPVSTKNDSMYGIKLGGQGEDALHNYPGDDIFISGNTINCTQGDYDYTWGISLKYGSSGNLITENGMNGCLWGIDLNGYESTVKKNVVKDNAIKNNGSGREGIYLGWDAVENIIESNYVSGYNSGIYMHGGQYHPLRTTADVSGNILMGNTSEENYYALYMYNGARNNKFYNNVFKKKAAGYSYLTNSINTENKCGSTVCPNEFNLPELKEEMNVVGGPYTGGNYWSTYTGTDANKDGIGDTSFSSSGITDRYPLLLPQLRIIPGDMNPKNKPYLKGEPADVLHIKVENNDRNNRDIALEKMTFAFMGNGKITDVTNVYLYKGSSCNDLQGSLLKSGGFSGNTVLFDGMNEIVSKGIPVCYFIRYNLQTPTPCAEYGALTAGSGAKAKIPADGSDVQIGGMASGTLNMGYPEIALYEPLKRSGVVKKPLDTPLPVMIKDVDGEDTPFWKAKYVFSQVPGGATGYTFDNEDIEKLTPFNAQLIATSGLTLGDKIGLYNVSVTPELSGGNYQCPDTTPQEKIYEVFAAGIEVSAQNDGMEGDTFGTYITGIEAKNKFTAIPKLPPGDTRTVKKVTFKMGNTIKEDTAEPYEAEFNMAEAKNGEYITVSAIMSDNSVVEQEYPIKAITLPGWFDGVKTIVKSIESKFEDDKDRYRITFTYPTDFIWSNPIPSWVPVLGAEEEEVNFTSTIGADFYLNENTGFLGQAEFKGEILGKGFTIKGEIEGQFDRSFNLLPGTTGSVYGELNFPLPEKTLASKTIVVYGVPITVAMDVGGNIKVFVNAALVLDEKLKFSKLTFAPGTTIQLDLTASASAAFGVAKLGVKGSPTATLQIKLGYTTAGGLKQEAFGGEITIPITVFGSLFWDSISGDLCEPFVIGPYRFGSMGDAAGTITVTLESRKTPMEAGKRYYPSTAVATDTSGRKIMVYTKDISPSSTSINPEVYGKIYSGGSWGSEMRLTDNTLWEMDTDVTFLKDGKALAVWTSNKLDKNITGNNLHTILKNQDIAYAYYNGTSWSGAGSIINDDFSDGNARVAYDANSNKAMAVWVHNTNREDTMDPKGRQLYYSIFDAGASTPYWSTPAVIPTTDDTAADYMPALASDGEGRFHIVWVKDGDGKIFDLADNTKDNWSATGNINSDSDIYYVVYNVGTGQWGSPLKITPTDNAAELMPSVALFGSEAIIAYIKRQGQEDKLYLTRSSNFQIHETLDSGGYLIEDPKISIYQNKAIIAYRKHSGTEDEIYKVEKDLNQGQSPVIKKVTDSGTLKHAFSGATASDGSLVFTWTSIENLTPPSIGMAEAVDGMISFTGNNTVHLYDIRNDAVDGIMVTIPVKALKRGKFSLRADLYDETGNAFISRSLGQQIEAEQDQEQNLSLIFPGREISASGINGPYTVKNIVILENTGSIVEAARMDSTIKTEAYQGAIFRPQRIILDRTVYTDTQSSMKIRIEDENVSGQTIVAKLYTSAEAGVKTITLTGVDGVFQKDVTLTTTTGGSDTLKVADGTALRVSYTDTKGKEWNAAAVWVIGPKTLTIKFAGTGSGRVSTSRGDCTGNCTLIFSHGQSITVSAISSSDSYLFGWGNTECTQQDTCTLTMDGNKEIEVTFIKIPPGMYRLTLNSGWNFISLPVQPEDSSCNVILKDISNNLRVVWGYDNEFKVWKFYKTDKLTTSTLGRIDGGLGYWVYMNKDAVFTVSGTPQGEWRFPEHKGWNLIGWAGKDNTAVSSFMEPHKGKWDIIWGWENGTWRARHEDPDFPLNIEPLIYFNKGKAYWIKVR
ncbi:MAG: hypothetical protein N2745_11060 [Syntrophorhabdaceae bacterium]|nr:hypothetical protein [Syntrophorhabdaceae bacterium]